MHTTDILFRCSQLGSIFTNAKTKGDISETAKTACIQAYCNAHGRRYEASSKQTEKGLFNELYAIQMVGEHLGLDLEKNAVRLHNEWITGECDVKHNRRIVDTKCSFSLATFLKSKTAKLDKDHELQGQGYMWLYDCDIHTVAYVLTNSPAHIIDSEKRSAYFQFGLDRLEGIAHAHAQIQYDNWCMQIEKNHIFDLETFLALNPGYELKNDAMQWHYDIPMKERIHTVTIHRDEAIIEEIIHRVTACREWIEKYLIG